MNTVLCIILLTFYLAGASQFQGLHQLFHWHDHSVSHSELQEQDPCHRAIYHDDQEKGCGHHSHIVVTDKCELCDLTSPEDQIILSSAENKTIQFFSIDQTFGPSKVTGIRQTIDSSRAPPVI